MFNEYIDEHARFTFIAVLDRLILFKKMEEDNIRVKDDALFFEETSYYQPVNSFEYNEEIIKYYIEESGIGSCRYSVGDDDIENNGGIPYEFSMEVTVNGLGDAYNRLNTFSEVEHALFNEVIDSFERYVHGIDAQANICTNGVCRIYFDYYSAEMDLNEMVDIFKSIYQVAKTLLEGSGDDNGSASTTK